MQNTETKDVSGKVMKELNPDEAKLIDELRIFDYGRAVIFKDNDKCIRVEEIIKSKKL